MKVLANPVIEEFRRSRSWNKSSLAGRCVIHFGNGVSAAAGVGEDKIVGLPLCWPALRCQNAGRPTDSATSHSEQAMLNSNCRRVRRKKSCHFFDNRGIHLPAPKQGQLWANIPN